VSTWPDVEGSIETYLKAHVPLVSNRVYFGIPVGADKAAKLWPLITVTRIGGGQDSSEAPIDLALIQIDVWGSLRKKQETWAVVAQVRSVLEGVRGNTALDGTVTAFGAEVVSVAFLPDPASDRPRYVITTQVVALVSP
jgi:hypothetical protein